MSLQSVAQDYETNIDKVTTCFESVLEAFRKLLHEEKDCELPFPKIGKLQVKNKYITMKFYREFLEKQNQNLVDRMECEKKSYHALSYSPNSDANEYEKQVNYYCRFRK